MSSPKTSDNLHKVTREHLKNVKTGAERLDRHSGKFTTHQLKLTCIEACRCLAFSRHGIHLAAITFFEIQ